MRPRVLGSMPRPLGRLLCVSHRNSRSLTIKRAELTGGCHSHECSRSSGQLAPYAEAAFPTPSTVAYAAPRGGGVKGGAAAEHSSGTLDAAEHGDRIPGRWRQLSEGLTSGTVEPGATQHRCVATRTGVAPGSTAVCGPHDRWAVRQRYRAIHVNLSARAVPCDVTRRGDIEPIGRLPPR
jgi:hypothetical protein